MFLSLFSLFLKKSFSSCQGMASTTTKQLLIHLKTHTGFAIYLDFDPLAYLFLIYVI